MNKNPIFLLFNSLTFSTLSGGGTSVISGTPASHGTPAFYGTPVTRRTNIPSKEIATEIVQGSP